MFYFYMYLYLYFYFTTIIIIMMTYPIILFIFFFICLRVFKKTLGEAMVCGLEKHCGDLTTTSLPIIATVQCHRRQPPRQCTMSRSGPRFSGMWKQVLGLYRGFLRGQHILNFLKIGNGLNHSFSAEFRRNSKLVDQKNFLYIEYLFHQGKLTRKRRSSFSTL